MARSTVPTEWNSKSVRDKSRIYERASPEFRFERVRLAYSAAELRVVNRRRGYVVVLNEVSLFSNFSYRPPNFVRFRLYLFRKKPIQTDNTRLSIDRFSFVC